MLSGLFIRNKIKKFMSRKRSSSIPQSLLLMPNPKISKVTEKMDNVIESTLLNGFEKSIYLTFDGFLKACELNNIGNIYKLYTGDNVLFYYIDNKDVVVGLLLRNEVPRAE